MPTKSDLIRRCFAAYKTGDRKALEDAFADDFAFTSPYDDAIDKAAYFERCWPISTSGRMVSNEVERIFEQGGAAFVTYRVVTKTGDEFRNTEFFVFQGDRVKSIDVYFGASYRNGQFVAQKES
jgi:ketosteroid isomerase-like protein